MQEENLNKKLQWYLFFIHFKNLSIMEELSKEEMKRVMGGKAEQVYATVSCAHQVGTWQYTSIPTCDDLGRDVGLYCRDGEGVISPGSQCQM